MYTKIISNLTESDFENLIINILRENKMIHLSNDESYINERTSGRSCILSKILYQKIQQLNPGLTQSQINKTIKQLEWNQTADILRSNFAGLKSLRDGVKIDVVFPQKRTITVKIVDFETPKNNSFHFINQFYMITQDKLKHYRAPDLVVFLNGLPIVVMEFKNFNTPVQNALEKAQNQIRTYQKELLPLFTYNVFNVVSNFNITKFGTLNCDLNKEKYFFWRLPNYFQNKNESPIVLFKEVFKPKIILDLIKFFTFFDAKKTQKFIASYHQYYATNKAVESVLTGLNSNNFEDKKAGIIWHAQGTGKTLTMVFLVKKLLSIEAKATVILITDRISLDQQIFEKFSKATDFLGQNVQKIKTRQNLQQILKNQKQNGIFATTLQKFQFDKIDTILSKRSDLLIISDEAHRSQREIDIKIKHDWNNKIWIEHKSYARNLRTAFPNATFIGFTATPIETQDHATTQVFGNYIHKYLIDQAEKDGFVVGIRYELRSGRWDLDPTILAAINYKNQIITDKLKQETNLPLYAINKINQDAIKSEKFLSDPDRIDAIAHDFIKHYENRLNILKGKAMFVASSRKIAVQYYYKILEIRATWKKKIRLIITANVTDGPEMNELIKRFNHESSAIDFKKPDSEFKIAIVVNKWLTGFDVPVLDVMYIDKIFHQHNLMQAIARVNRHFTDKNNELLFKEKGLIVDYIGFLSPLKKAIEMYTVGGTIDENQILDLKSVHDIIPELQKIVDELFKKYVIDEVDIEKWKAKKDYLYCFGLIEHVQNNIYKLHAYESKINHVLKYVNSVNKIKTIFATVSSCLHDSKYSVLLAKLQLLLLVKKRIVSLEVGGILSRAEYQEYQKKLDHEIANLIDFKTINKPMIIETIDLEDIVKFIKQFRISKNKYLAAKKFTNLVKNFIFKYLSNDMILCKNLSEKLEQRMQEFNQQQISAEKIVAEIKEVIIDQIKKDIHLKHLNNKERSFYKLLLNYKVKSEHTDQYIQQIAKEIYIDISKELDNDWLHWHVSEGNRIIVRHRIRKCLERNGYPQTVIDKILSLNMLYDIEQNINMGEYSKNKNYSEDFIEFFKSEKLSKSNN